MILAGAGVGGGSLNYANTLYVPPAPFFEDPQWGHITDWQDELAPHYDVAQSMLGVVTNTLDGEVEDIMRKAAAEMGVSETYRKTPVGVFFGAPGETVPDPYFGGAGPARTGCIECGNCMVGCRVGAKNTLMKNYLALAESLGVVIEPMRSVLRISEVPGQPGMHRVLHERTGPTHGKDLRITTAPQIVVAAGTWGTQKLLHTMKAEGELPRLSERLGELTRTNSEAILGAETARAPKGMDLSKGIAITSSFHPDEDTHVENVRYGPGSNVMGGLQTLLVAGNTGRPRPLQFLRDLVTNPKPFLKMFPNVRKWSERSIILLVMQSVDNSLTTSVTKHAGRWWLTSRQGHGEPNPTYIPAGHEAAEVITRRLAEATGEYAAAGGTWPEVFDVPLTAHFLGGVVIGDSAESGVIDPYHRLWGHPGISVVDGSAISANLGVNPSLTITAQAERAFSMWPVKGEEDPRPSQGEAYRRLDPVPPLRRAVARFTHAESARV